MDLKSIEKYIQIKIISSFKFDDNRNSEIPFTKLKKPISEAKIALISSGGFYIKGDKPFDTEAVLGDTTYRRIPKNTNIEDLDIAHTHYNHSYVKEDMNSGFPLPLFRELEENNKVGELAETNYSFSGYILKTDEIIKDLGPKIALELKDENVDCVIISPM